jgi:signal transduction histidine kinase
MQRSLYPTVLDNLGLEAAIDDLVGDFQESSGVACNLDMDGEPFELDIEKRQAVYRIVQEALINVTRHAQASEVDVVLRREGSILHVEIRDDGRGLDAEAERETDSYGLTAMRKRAEICGGSMTIRAQDGEGTVIAVEVPLEPAA